jgi:hypothetical protein
VNVLLNVCSLFPIYTGYNEGINQTFSLSLLEYLCFTISSLGVHAIIAVQFFLCVPLQLCILLLSLCLSSFPGNKYFSFFGGNGNKNARPTRKLIAHYQKQSVAFLLFWSQLEVTVHVIIEGLITFPGVQVTTFGHVSHIIGSDILRSEYLARLA